VVCLILSLFEGYLDMSGWRSRSMVTWCCVTSFMALIHSNDVWHTQRRK
jgi:hypothetical protein